MTFSFIKNTDNQPDTALTMLVIAFIILMGKIIVSGMIAVIGDKTLTFGILDGGLFAGVITPLAALYGFRRHTDITNNAVEALPATGGEKQTKSTTPPDVSVAVQNVATEIKA